MYDEMKRAMETGEVYRTRLVPGRGIGRWRMRGGWGWSCKIATPKEKITDNLLLLEFLMKCERVRDDT
jgi:hypothetical protein